MRYDVGIISTHVSPAAGFGGVAVSIARLVNALVMVSSRQIGFCSSNASADGSICMEDVGFSRNLTIDLYRSHFFKRWGFGLGAIPKILHLSRCSRKVYINGIATWPTTLAAIICCINRKPFIVAPRGGLMPEHVRYIRQNKPAKWLFYRTLTFPTIKNAWVLHCTGKTEAKGVEALFGKSIPMAIIPNGIDLPPVSFKKSLAIETGLIMAYVGRISHEKGINAFLRCWLENRRPHDKFLIAGDCPGKSEANYFKNFQSIVAKSRGAIEYRGYLSNSEVKNLIKDAHFLVLPSGLDGDVRENFGNVVAEAFSLARPVIVCKGLEWDDVEKKQTGFVFDCNKAGAISVIRRANELQTDTWLAMSANARKYAEEHLDIRITAQRLWDVMISSSSESIIRRQF